MLLEYKKNTAAYRYCNVISNASDLPGIIVRAPAVRQLTTPPVFDTLYEEFDESGAFGDRYTGAIGHQVAANRCSSENQT